MYMNAYHKDQGEVRMFEVDARNAIARFPDEWSDKPWLADATEEVTVEKTCDKKTEKPLRPEDGNDGIEGSKEGPALSRTRLRTY